MGHIVKQIYKQALAHYNIASKKGYCVATLLQYEGPKQNRPPARFIVVESSSSCPHLLRRTTLTDDMEQPSLKSKHGIIYDPLFPEKKHRQPVDQLV